MLRSPHHGIGTIFSILLQVLVYRYDHIIAGVSYSKHNVFVCFAGWSEYIASNSLRENQLISFVDYSKGVEWTADSCPVLLLINGVFTCRADE